MSEYSIFDQEIGLDPWMRKPSDIPVLVQDESKQSSVVAIAGGSSQKNGIRTNDINSGELGSVLSFAKKNFSDTAAGWIQGMDRDGVYKWLVGDSASSIDWAVTTANTLTIVGAINATTGTIGGFSIGTDYIRDAGNSFGLASTVTGGDDIRFWAGATFANRSSAPFYITEAGALVATSATINGSTMSAGDVFGDGSDGDVTISVDTTLTSDMFYDDLTIQTGKILNPGGYRIFVKGTLTFQGTGKIACNGTAGTNGTTGHSGEGIGGTQANAAGTLPASGTGGNGGEGGDNSDAQGTAGTAGSTAAKGIGSAGAAGGSSSKAAGAAGAITGTVFNKVRNFPAAYHLFDANPSFTWFAASGGSGGGGGGNAGAPGNDGGGGGGAGSAGGFVWVAAKTIVTVDGNTCLQAEGKNGGNGGNGAAGGSGGAGGGGGGGGSGGVIILIYGTLSGTGTTSVTAGTGGTGGTGGAGNGNNGSDGTAGKVYTLII